MIHDNTPLDLSVIVLSTDQNPANLKVTASSMGYLHHCRETICVVDKNISKEDLIAFKEICPTYKGKDTITSLINTGMKKIKGEWGFLVYSGSRIRIFLEKKIAWFAKSERDILFPVVDGKYHFPEGSSNGILINKKTFKEIGDFPEETMAKAGVNDFELAKMFWAMEAVNKGCTFKAIVGMRII